MLQGSGCLNYALVLRITANGPLRSITSANQFIMERNRAAITGLIPGPRTPQSWPEITVSGHTDLAIGGRKFSGNSQRRKKNFLLFHGTFLLDFNLALVGEFLQMPTLQPDYRASRGHEDFLTNLNLPADKVKAALQTAWKATDELQDFPRAEAQRLAMEKYSTAAWNLKW